MQLLFLQQFTTILTFFSVTSLPLSDLICVCSTVHCLRKDDLETKKLFLPPYFQFSFSGSLPLVFLRNKAVQTIPCSAGDGMYLAAVFHSDRVGGLLQ